MKRYATKDDAILREFPDVVSRTAGYDVDAIFAETFEYRVDVDADGNELLNTAGFEQIVGEDDFWAIADKHARKS